jgi:hypothetical protein
MSWRDLIDVHPDADIFPMADEAQLKAWAEDIKKNDMKVPIVIARNQTGDKPVLWDGRNRLEAIERFTDIPIKVERGMIVEHHKYLRVVRKGGDPRAVIASLNLHRRHLTAAQKRELIGKLLKADPTKSNRQIAAETGTDKNTVKAARLEKERTGEIHQLAETVGRDGKKRKQPVKKAKQLTAPPTAPEPAPARESEREVDFSKIESDKPIDFWQRSLENIAARAATLTSYWDHQFGKEWREFKITQEMVYFADQAAAEWNRVAAELKQRSLRCQSAADEQTVPANRSPPTAPAEAAAAICKPEAVALAEAQERTARLEARIAELEAAREQEPAKPGPHDLDAPDDAVTDEEREVLAIELEGSKQKVSILQQEVRRLQKKLRNANDEIRRLKKRLGVEADAPPEDAAKVLGAAGQPKRKRRTKAEIAAEPALTVVKPVPTEPDLKALRARAKRHGYKIRKGLVTHWRPATAQDAIDHGIDLKKHNAVQWKEPGWLVTNLCGSGAECGDLDAVVRAIDKLDKHGGRFLASTHCGIPILPSAG